MADGLALLQFAGRTGLNLCALTTVGLGLHAMAGIVTPLRVKHLQWLGVGAAGALLLFLVSRIALLATQMSGGKEVFNADLWSLAWSILELSTLTIGIGLVIVAGGLIASSRIAAGIGAVLVAIGFALTGHTQSLDHPEMPSTILALHVLIASYWFAAPFTLTPKHLANDELADRLRRFSAIAVLAIPVMIFAGVWLAWTLTGSWEKLAGSAYGQLLLFKLAIATIALAAGAYNKGILTTGIAAAQPKARAQLATTLRIELAIFVAATLAVSAATTVLAPNW